MSIELAFIDPAIFVWDVPNFQANQGRYWALASDVVSLMEVIEACGLRITARTEMINSILESFPVEHLNHGVSELRDFSNLTLSFLSRDASKLERYECNNILACDPDIRNRPYFSVDLKDETGYALHYGLENSAYFKVFSHELIIGSPSESVSINTGVKNDTVECFSTFDRYSEFHFRHLRIYEEHLKHDALGGYGSRLPLSLTKEDLQELLNGAKSTDDERLLVVFSIKAERFIVFRRHVANYYHAYPVEERELSRIGVNPSKVPSI